MHCKKLVITKGNPYFRLGQNQHEFEDNFANMNKLPINFSIPGHKVYIGGKLTIQAYPVLCILTLPKLEL